jgi:uncharacterized protein YggE
MKNLLFFIAILLISINLYSQENSSLIVEGKAIIREVPENIRITIDVTSTNPDYAICSDNLVKSSNNLQKDLIDHGIDSKTIKANNFSVKEDIDYHNGIQTKKGFIGLIEFTIEGKFSINIVNTTMEVMKKNEYKFNYNVEFILSETQKQSLINYAIENAIADAKMKADIIAKAANIELVKIESITYPNEYKLYDYQSDLYNFDRIRYRSPMAVMVGSSMDNNQMSINQEEVAVEKTVTIKWITKTK